MVLRRYYIFFFFIFFYFQGFSQSFYATDSVREIRISFYDNNWNNILDSFYVAGSKNRILADILIDGNTYDSVGVRYKGFSSVSVNQIKNPFNIKLDYIIDDQSHEGIDKIKLSNVIQDPSFIREVLSYEIIRKYMPASQANFTNLFINDTLWGLYTNVEAVNKEFLIDHFSSKYNPFFKCNPDHLDIQIGGENSNLSDTHGTDTLSYLPYYDIESNYGWTELYDLIDTLNNFEDHLINALNIDRVLWMHALNYTMINFDSYIGYSQNYYLYKTQDKQWNPIIWDLNMSFGGFRLTDASQLYFNGFDINQAQNMDPLSHYNLFSVSPRPLMQNIFSNERHRKMYLAHIRTIVQENFENNNYYVRGQDLQNLIDLDVQNDSNKFYTYNDFVTNLTDQVSLVASICPGITQLMDTRVNYLTNYSGYQGEPVISNISYYPQNLNLGDDIWITAEILDADYAMISFRFGKNQRFRILEMFDDGNHNDGASGDGVYGIKIPKCSNSIDYYMYAENTSSGVFSPERAAYHFYNIKVKIDNGDLVINELMSNNKNIVKDQSGKYEDWIELYNTTAYPISTYGLYLTDTLSNLLKWDLPNYVVAPDSYLTIWADEDGGQGDRHANFKLSNLGEHLILSNSDSSIIDSVVYPSQIEDVSYGRSPNGIGVFTMLTPTFNANNDVSFINNYTDHFITAYPNPFNNTLFIDAKDSYVVVDIYGREVFNGFSSKINTSEWNTGIYFIYLNHKTVIKVLKI